MAVESPTFGTLLRRLRLAGGLTQEELAERAGLSVRGISDLERGVNRAPRPDTARLLVEALGLPPDDEAMLLAAARSSDEPALDVEAASLSIGGFLGALPTRALVARDEELNRIVTTAESVILGQGRFLLLAGEPGIGKTRLAQEVSGRLVERGFLVAAGRCYEPEGSLPYYPFFEVMRALYFGVPEPLRAAAPYRWPYLARLLPNEDFRTPPPLYDAHEEQLRLFYAVGSFLEAAAISAPVALLFDDLHWSDTSSLSLLRHLVRTTRPMRVLLLGTYRDVEVGRHHPLEATLVDLRREELLERVRMRRLDQQGTAALLAGFLGEDEAPQELAATIHWHTDGNPFFTLEVARALLDRGDLVKDDGTWRVSHEIMVPESVRAVIGQRLSRLSDTTQETLQVASVLGNDFSFEHLARTSGRNELELERSLEAGLDAGLIQAAGPDSYSFNHGLIQQSIYEELPPRRRRRLHLAAAEALEPPEAEHLAARAWHFLQADDCERALPACLTAGDAAIAVGAHDQARQHFQTALELAQELGDALSRAQAQEKLGTTYNILMEWSESDRLLRHALDFYRQTGDVEGEARALNELYVCMAHTKEGSFEEGLRQLQRLLPRVEERGPSLTLASLYSRLVGFLFNAGHYDEMIPAAQRAIDIADALQDPRCQARAVADLARAYMSSNALEARRLGIEALRRVEGTGDLELQHWIQLDLGALCLWQGDFFECERYTREALEISERIHFPSKRSLLLQNIGEVLIYVGRWDEAEMWLRQSQELIPSPTAWAATYPEANLGILALFRGDRERARDHLDRALANAERHQDMQGLRYGLAFRAELDLREGRPDLALARLTPAAERHPITDHGILWLQAPLAEARLALGDIQGAEATVEPAVDFSRTHGFRWSLVDLLRVQATINHARGRLSGAEATLAEAIEIARAMPYPYAEARSLHARGLVRREMGRNDAGDDLQAAAARFQDLGARRDLVSSQEVLASIDGSL